MSYELAGLPVQSPSTTSARLAMLLWGDSGCGKTTLAATAPGIKLIIQFDPDGALSIANRDDVRVLDLSGQPYLQVIQKCRADDPYGIGKLLNDHQEIETVIIDSMTMYAYVALQEAVSKNRNSTIEQPGIHGYGWRNASVLHFAQSMLTITAKHNRNIIYITHEAAAETDEQGNTTSITMALSKGIANQLGLRFNEVWFMMDAGKQRTIVIRPHMMRRPMKTRMFDASKNVSFAWKYDAQQLKGDGINEWLTQWRANGGNKISLPS